MDAQPPTIHTASPNQGWSIWSRARPLLMAVGLAIAALPVSARSLESIRDSGTLRICVAGSSAQLYQANGEAFARFLKVKSVVTHLATFDEQFHNEDGRTVKDADYEPRLLGNGSCDIFPNDLHVASWRESKMQIVPYYTVRKVIVARSALRGKIRATLDLGGLTAAVQDGTAYSTWLDQLNTGELAQNRVAIVHAATEDSIRRVADGQADFTVLGTDGALKWARTAPDRLSILFPVDESVSVGWGIQKSAHALGKELKLFFDDSARVGSDLDKNWQSYYKISLTEYRLFQASFETTGVDLKTILAWVAPIASVVLALLVVLLTWNLRNAVRHKKSTEAIRKNLETTIDAIAATVESRDPYTAGHQRRVAQLAVAIAREMQLPEALIEGLHFGALIHDLGKIRVPDELLCKPSRLTAAEFNVLKMHPEVGYEIVRGINFPWPVATMIRQHHERINGSGYPEGLKGDQILVEAKILAVADTVEAMASHRPYRAGLGVESALLTIEQGSGQLYDPEVAQACLRIFQSGFTFSQ